MINTYNNQSCSVASEEGPHLPIQAKKNSEAKQEWMKNNSKVYSVRVMKNTEQDIFEYLEGKIPGEEFKKGIRLLIQQEMYK